MTPEQIFKVLADLDPNRCGGQPGYRYVKTRFYAAVVETGELKFQHAVDNTPCTCPDGTSNSVRREIIDKSIHTNGGYCLECKRPMWDFRNDTHTDAHNDAAPGTPITHCTCQDGGGYSSARIVESVRTNDAVCVVCEKPITNYYVDGAHVDTHADGFGG